MTKESGFQLSGSAAEAYENVWIPSLMGKCARDLVESVYIKSGDSVLDVGCGTGVVARIAAKIVGAGGKVVGTDVNESMIDAAKRYAEKDKRSDIEWQVDDATQMSFDDVTFDVVLCQQGLQFMPDKQAAMSEFFRVMRPGGRLALNVWRAPSPFSIALAKVLDQHFGEGTTAPWQVAFSLSDRDELREMATDAGLKNAHVSFDVKMTRHASPMDFVLGAISGSPMASKVAAMESEHRIGLVSEIVRELDKYIDDDGIAAPGECYTLTAAK